MNAGVQEISLNRGVGCVVTLTLRMCPPLLAGGRKPSLRCAQAPIGSGTAPDCTPMAGTKYTLAGHPSLGVRPVTALIHASQPTKNRYARRHRTTANQITHGTNARTCWA